MSGNDAKGEYIEMEVWANSAADALKIAQEFNDGNTYTVARKAGCGCGGS
ncbi:hypothetical protein [Metabacillus fastidiosus]